MPVRRCPCMAFLAFIWSELLFCSSSTTKDESEAAAIFMPMNAAKSYGRTKGDLRPTSDQKERRKTLLGRLCRKQNVLADEQMP